MDKRTKDVMTDLIAMLEHYTSGRPDNWDGSTKRQALVTIKEARKLMEEVKFVEHHEFLHEIMFRNHKDNTNG